MRRIRVMLGEMPPMLSSLVTVLFAAEEQVELVPVPAGRPLARALHEEAVDVVVLRADRPEECDSIMGGLACAAPIGVVAISHSGQSALAYRLHRYRIAATGEGRLDLVGALAAAAGRASPDAMGERA